MRIVSKFHDYYDTVMVHGVDPSVVFVRKKKEYKNLKKDFSPELEEYLSTSLSSLNCRTYLRPEPFAIIFCGMLYKGIRSYEKEERGNWLVPNNKSLFCYNPEECIESFKNLYKNPEDEFATKVYMGGRYKRMPLLQKLEMFFEDVGSDRFMNLMVEKRCSILYIIKEGYYGHLKAVENPILRGVDFFKIIDPYTAYQRLSMFIGGVLPREANPTVEISDEDMAVKKGFDKWSFRKMKGD